jgi:glutamate--cysteine ligase
LQLKDSEVSVSQGSSQSLGQHLSPELLAAFAEPANNASLRGILRGLEKESLRVTPEGTLAQTDHPQALGSALTHH